ncbi:hypothetical protein [Spirosoma sp. KNUC1025]|uniref:hypothetical protein n=1 Tax=Spirosoma sp. KNUC1025 TaxID=2894082 RepID=UPI00386472AE|nr:hypothetical protein LN737_07325 [Spirosoma sp. KNUC1025]
MKTMKMRVKLVALAALLAPVFLSACTVTAPATTQGPPPARVEVIPAAPSVRHVWIPGHYVRRGRNYRWVNGYYRVVPPRYSAWAPGYWRQTRRGSTWVDGRWR